MRQVINSNDSHFTAREAVIERSCTIHIVVTEE